MNTIASDEEVRRIADANAIRWAGALAILAEAERAEREASCE